MYTRLADMPGAAAFTQRHPPSFEASEPVVSQRPTVSEPVYSWATFPREAASSPSPSSASGTASVLHPLFTSPSPDPSPRRSILPAAGTPSLFRCSHNLY
ncbi:hypothetical protein AUP68_13070 [Ilyonectria robusta]